MADQLYAGTNAAFAGSMAEAMEQAMDDLLFADKGIHLPRGRHRGAQGPAPPVHRDRGRA